MEEMKINTIEREMEQASAMMVRTAKSMTITNNDDYERGSDILKDIKSKVKAVKEYWKEPKAAAQAAHKQLVAREAQMLKPLEEAESVIKKAMLAYDAEIKRRQREAEEAARKAQEEERARLAAIAAEAEKNGDTDSAEFMRDMMDMVETPEIMADAAPAAKGLSVRKTWKARVIDPKLVPAYFDGYELRTVNMTMLNNIAKWQNGEAKIPGVEFYQESSMSVRA